jgi:hypothetical protein
VRTAKNGILGLISQTLILCAAFTSIDPKSTKKTDELTVVFCAIVIYSHKAFPKHVVEIEPKVEIHKTFYANL